MDEKGQQLRTIKGLPPNLMHIPPGCPFNPRCPMAQAVCREKLPPLVQVGSGRASACHFAEELVNRD
jgi:oligopeptide transport system ATP-binding protein